MKLAKSEATRLRLIDSAIAEVVQSGVDRIGFTSIAKRSGMSTGALYARYENADELIIDVWQTRCVPALERLIDNLVGLSDSEKTEEAGQDIADIVNSMDPQIVAAIGIMAVARRNEALREEVYPAVWQLVGAGTARLPIVPHALAHVLGLMLLIRGTGHHGLDWSLVTKHIAGATCEALQRLSEADGVPTIGVAPAEVERHRVDGLDDVDARLFDAVTHVVGRVGVDHATVSRIARRAGVNPATIYLKYQDKEALVASCMRIVCDAASSRNEQLVADHSAGKDITDFAEIVFRSNASDEYEGERLLRLESLYASGHHPALCATHRDFYRSTTEAYGRAAGLDRFDDSRTVWKFVFLNWATFFGHALLRIYGYLGPDDPHIRTMADAMVRAHARGRPIAQDL